VLTRHGQSKYGGTVSTSVYIGYGEFLIHEERDPDENGNVPGASIGSDGYVSFNMGLSSIGFYDADYTYSPPCTYHVYKKELIEPLLGDFYHENYNIKVGQLFRVGLTPTGGSGYYSITEGSKPAFLIREDFGSWSGVCFVPALTSFSAIVTDIVTGETREAFATIIISEDPVDPTFPDDTTDVDDMTDDDDDTDTSSDSSAPGTSSDPGGTAADPGSSSSGDGGNNGGDDGTSAGDGDTGDNSGDDGGNDDDSGAVDPGGSDDEPATEPDDSSDDADGDDETEDNNDPDDSSATDPGSDDNTDSPADSSTADNPDDTDNSADQTNSSGDDDAVVVVPDGTDPTDTSSGSDIADDGSDSSDNSDTVIISDDTEAGEPTIIVINDSTGSDSDKIVVTNDGVIKVDSDNYDLAVFMGMFGAMTALNGSAATTESAPMAVQEARRGKDHE
jgi:hypothetical protein